MISRGDQDVCNDIYDGALFDNCERPSTIITKKSTLDPTPRS